MFGAQHNARLTLAAHHARPLEGLYSKHTSERETKDRHQAVFMVLKGKGHDDNPRYKRLGVVKVSSETDEEFIMIFQRKPGNDQSTIVSILGDTTMEPDAKNICL